MKNGIVISLVLLFVATYACSPGAAPPAKTAPPAAVPTVVRPDLASNWNTLIAEAKKEGTVVIAGGFLGASRPALTNAFKEKYGIDLDITVAAGEQTATKIDSERKAGIYSVDVAVHGLTTYFNFIKQKRITLPLEPLFMLPEVRDASKWRQGQFPWADKEGHVAVILLGVNPTMVVNNDMVKPGDITTNLDVLDPRWRGKLAMNDPTAAGTGPAWFTFIVKELYGMEKGTNYMRQLLKQEPALTRDQRLLIEWVARGKYAVALAPTVAQTTDLIRSGAPIRYPEMKEPTLTTSSTGNIFAFDKAPHPNAARLFVNWILSKEGATVFSKAHGFATTRPDVPTEGLVPALIPKPDDPILGEDYEAAKTEMMKVAKEIFAPLLK
ncbi:MAG: extracellular solute-binding protein [Chloroflexi bacterium]|nr:extracellular solute-binding protein [Chloroflexota bacterium]